jgi:hypothetical protein
MALIELVLAGDVDREVAAPAAPNRHDFLVALDRAEKARVAEAARTQTEAEAPPAEENAEASELPRLRMIAPVADAHGQPA